MSASADRTTADALAMAATVADPEMPMLTLLDLGVLRGLTTSDDGTVTVSITPTYSGCPAMATMRADLQLALLTAGFERVEVRTVLSPPWTSDWITADGRRKLAEHGISPPGRAPRRAPGPVPLSLRSRPRPLDSPALDSPALECPQCGSHDTELTSEFGGTACRSLYRCRTCREPFEHVKEI